MYVRGCVLEDYSDAAAPRGFFDGLFGLVAKGFGALTVAEASALQAATRGGRKGARVGIRVIHPPNRRTWPRSTRRTIEGSITWMMNAGGVQGAGRTTRKGTKGASRNVQGRKEVFANVSA